MHILYVFLSIINNIREIQERTFPLTEEEEKASSLDEIKFIFSQAEKLLKESLSASDLIISRTITVITLVSAAILALFSFLVSHTIENHKYELIDSCLEPSNATATIGLIGLLYMASQLYSNIETRTFSGTGTQPVHLLKDTYFHVYYEYEEKAREKAYYLTEIYSYQKRIEINNQINAERGLRLNTAIRYLLASPILLVVVFIVCIAISRSWCQTCP